MVKKEKEKKEKAPKKNKFSNYLFQASSVFIRLCKSSTHWLIIIRKFIKKVTL
jgi:hypothetical protein